MLLVTLMGLTEVTNLLRVEECFGHIATNEILYTKTEKQQKACIKCLYMLFYKRYMEKCIAEE